MHEHGHRSGPDNSQAHDAGGQVDHDGAVPSARIAPDERGNGVAGDPAAGSRDPVERIDYDLILMDQRFWFSRERGGGWRTFIDTDTGRATSETAFVEPAAYERMLMSGRATAHPIAPHVVSEAHPWFAASTPIARLAGGLPYVRHEIAGGLDAPVSNPGRDRAA
jgi:hypothetical protein